MIYITGDTHGTMKRFQKNIFPEQKEMTKKDYVIVCGDFGLIWDQSNTSNENSMITSIEKKSFTTLFVDGNHENHDRLDQFPISEWNGGKVHKISPSIIHLMRGQVYDIDGIKFYTFGGARSHDIDYLLDPSSDTYSKDKRKLDLDGKLYRIIGRSWWKREMPSEEEMKEGIENLSKVNNKVDFIISHDCPKSILPLIYSGSKVNYDKLNEYFEQIRKSIDFKIWFFGHYHENKQFFDENQRKFILLYEQIIRIS